MEPGRKGVAGKGGESQVLPKGPLSECGAPVLVDIERSARSPAQRGVGDSY